MLENVNEFIKNFRERLSSPFFFSFLISWIFVNWRVTVALLWYNPLLYPKEGDLINFIESNTSNWVSIGYPLISAIFYTGVVRNLISAFVTYGIKWGGIWNLNISKGGKVPMSKFLTYRNLFIKTNEELERVIKDEGKAIEQADELRQKNNELEANSMSAKSEILQLTSNNDELKLQLDSARNETAHYRIQNEKLDKYFETNQTLMSSYKDEKFIRGRWKFHYNNAFRDIEFEETFHIDDGMIQTIKGNSSVTKYKIEFYFNDTVNKKILLILSFMPDTPEANFINKINSEEETIKSPNEVSRRTYFRTKYSPTLIHNLDVKDTNTLVGTENVEARISYQRVER